MRSAGEVAELPREIHLPRPPLEAAPPRRRLEPAPVRIVSSASRSMMLNFDTDHSYHEQRHRGGLGGDGLLGGDGRFGRSVVVGDGVGHIVRRLLGFGEFELAFDLAELGLELAEALLGDGGVGLGLGDGFTLLGQLGDEIQPSQKKQRKTSERGGRGRSCIG